MQFINIKLIFFLLVLCTGCGNDKAEVQAEKVIPLPNSFTVKSNGTFEFDNSIKLAVSDESDERLQNLATGIINDFDNALSIELHQTDINSIEASDKSLILRLTSIKEASESYHLSITEQSIELSASSHHGLFNGVQTLKQLLFIQSGDNALSTVEIDDQPKLRYRGLMLDVGRHFFSVEQVKKTLDLMALYKLNTFHWHLTDDQGWRIEINKYPLLTTIGSYRSQTMEGKNFNPYVGDNTPHYGYYSQDDIRDVVQYAKDRYITIIPEIDMPGHMTSALAAYPEFACTEGPFVVPTYWGIFNDILCPSESTFEFVEDVLLEVMALFPSEYIHIGGDEVPITRWVNSDVAQAVIQENNLQDEDELQGYFYERVSDFLKEHGRKAIGWDEIQEKSLKQKTTVMIWRDIENTRIALENGHQVILTPTDFTYLNYYQGSQSTEPLAQCCMVTLEKVYQFEPIIDGLTDEQKSRILGAQGSMWTEYIKTGEHLEYMLSPRLIALSEVLWTNYELKDWTAFQDKLSLHTDYLDELNFNYKKPE